MSFSVMEEEESLFSRNSQIQIHPTDLWQKKCLSHPEKREKFEINADIFFLENSWIWGRRVVQYWKYIFHISRSMSASFEIFISHQKFPPSRSYPNEIAKQETFDKCFFQSFSTILCSLSAHY